MTAQWPVPDSDQIQDVVSQICSEANSPNDSDISPQKQMETTKWKHFAGKRWSSLHEPEMHTRRQSNLISKVLNTIIKHENIESNIVESLQKLNICLNQIYLEEYSCQSVLYIILKLYSIWYPQQQLSHQKSIEKQLMHQGSSEVPENNEENQAWSPIELNVMLINRRGGVTNRPIQLSQKQNENVHPFETFMRKFIFCKQEPTISRNMMNPFYIEHQDTYIVISQMQPMLIQLFELYSIYDQLMNSVNLQGNLQAQEIQEDHTVGKTINMHQLQQLFTDAGVFTDSFMSKSLFGKLCKQVCNEEICCHDFIEIVILTIAYFYPDPSLSFLQKFYQFVEEVMCANLKVKWNQKGYQKFVRVQAIVRSFNVTGELQ